MLRKKNVDSRSSRKSMVRELAFEMKSSAYFIIGLVFFVLALVEVVKEGHVTRVALVLFFLASFFLLLEEPLFRQSWKRMMEIIHDFVKFLRELRFVKITLDKIEIVLKKARRK